MVDPRSAAAAGNGHGHGPRADYRRRVWAGRLVALGIGVIAAAILVLAAPAMSAAGGAAVDDWTLLGAIGAACYVVLFLPRFRPGTGWQVSTESGQPSFAAVSTPGSAAMVLAIGPPLVAHGVLRTEAGPYQLMGVLSVIGACLIGLATLLVTERRRIVLTAIGLDIVGMLRRQRIPWDQIVPGQPFAPGRRERVMVRQLRPDRPRSDAELLPRKQLSVSPTRLAATIRFYVDHPARRGGIGTAAELATLLTDLDREARTNPAGRTATS